MIPKPLRLVLPLLLVSIAAAQLPLTPYPRQLNREPGQLQLRRKISIGAGRSAADQFAAGELARDLASFDGIQALVRGLCSASFSLRRARSTSDERDGVAAY